MIRSLASTPYATVEPALAVTAERISNPTRSMMMLSRVETLVTRCEERFGRERLLNTVAEIGDHAREHHVATYRTFIRTNAWPNTLRPSSLRVFHDEYERAAAQYVRIGFEAFDHLAGGGTGDIETVHRRVFASEALRGQFGKRSPTGLDERLDDIEAVLEEKIGGLGLRDIDGALTLLGTPGMNTPTAETLLLTDLRDLHQAFAHLPTAADIAHADRMSSEIAWRFLRRHCRWSVAHLQRLYVAYDNTSLTEMIMGARANRAVHENERLVLLHEIRANTTHAAFTELCKVVREVVTLNHINLTLEPSYSFKGGPGLAHGLLLQAVEKAGGLPIPPMEETQTEKWRLLSQLD